ncbi:MAG: hypothetical protein EHM33_00380 [Chloroflexi bacterium]|nr:MAG: hypothetical protein EHM33_00380 [Chloroflexota bacterium]
MNREAFFDVMRDEFGSLSQDQVNGTEALLDAAEEYSLPMNQLAYVLSTSWHETAATMTPIAEYGKGEGHEYGEPCSQYDNQVAYGRGYVQLTWDYNYEKADTECSLNGALLDDFDLALDPVVASQIIFRGMLEGWFTGKKLGDYVNDTITDYYNARRVVNGTDKADMLADYAESFEQALRAASYGEEETAPEVPEVPESGVTPEEGEHPPQYSFLVTPIGAAVEDCWELTNMIVWKRKR